jgi:outer membrane protein TolC
VISLPNNFNFNEEDMTMKEISISQKFPFPGKRGTSEEVAAREADAGAADIDEAANQVVKEVKTAFYDLSHVYRAVEVTERNKAILEELTKIAHTRYALGQGIQEDLISIQLEISKLVDDLIMLEQKKRSVAARLNYLLNRPPNTTVGQPENLEFSKAVFSIEDLQQRALEENPLLRTLKEEVAARWKSVDLAKQDYLPDFSLRFAYGQRDNRLDMYSGMFEMNLPLYVKSKQERKVAESYSEVNSAKARYESAQNEILYMIADMGSMVQRLERKLALYRTGIIPQSRLQIDTALSAYMVNKADFMALLDSRVRLYRYELDYHEALTEYEKSVAGLEAAVGRNLPREVLK